MIMDTEYRVRKKNVVIEELMSMSILKKHLEPKGVGKSKSKRID